MILYFFFFASSPSHKNGLSRRRNKPSQDNFSFNGDIFDRFSYYPCPKPNLGQDDRLENHTNPIYTISLERFFVVLIRKLVFELVLIVFLVFCKDKQWS